MAYMKEQKICTFTKEGYRLQLLKITDNNEVSYFQIRKNRCIVATMTSIEFAYKRFTNIVYQVTIQKQINFGEPEPIQAPERYSQKIIEAYEEEMLLSLKSL